MRRPVWLVLDIGNSSVKGGFFQNGFLTRTFRMASEPEASVSSYRHSLRHHVGEMALDRVGIVSVVPVLLEKLTSAVRLELMMLPEAVRSTMRLPIAMGYRTPDTLGLDRLAGVVGAWRRYGSDRAGEVRSVIVVDAGTAVTVDIVDRHGVYRGGAITPGPELMIRALSRGTAQLPEVDLQLPSKPIGRSTRESLQSGLMFGFVDAVSAMLERLAGEIGGPSVCVATGGWSAFLGRHIDRIDVVLPDLVLYGVHDLMEANPPGLTTPKGAD